MRFKIQRFVAILTETGELIGVLWFLLLGVTGAHMKGLL